MKDITERVIEHICDELCKHAVDPNLTQDKLDDICEGCIINEISRIEG